MMSASGGRFLTSLFSFNKLNVLPNIYCGSILQSRNYSLRPGTRERLRKRIARNVAAKRNAPPDPRELKKLKLNPPDAIKFIEEKYPRISPDDVWVGRYYSRKTYSFEEAIQCHREVLHPTMYNVPDAKIKAHIELNMTGVKNKKFVDAFSGLVTIPHKFKLEETRSVLVFAKTPEQQQEARDAGATLVAGSDIVRLIRIGELSLSDFDTAIAHPLMLAELLCIRGIMKYKFPTLKNGTLGTDLSSMINKQLYGISYKVTPVTNYPQCGTTDVTFGTLNMEMKQLEENFRAIMQDLESHKPQRPGPFTTRIRLRCPPNKEEYKLDLKGYVKEEEPVMEDDDEYEDTVATAEI